MCKRRLHEIVHVYCMLTYLVVEQSLYMQQTSIKTKNEVTCVLCACALRCALPVPRSRAASPERPRRVIAKLYEVNTGSKPSVIVGGGMGHDPVVLACTPGCAVQLYGIDDRQLKKPSGGPPRCE